MRSCNGNGLRLVSVRGARADRSDLGRREVGEAVEQNTRETAGLDRRHVDGPGIVRPGKAGELRIPNNA